MERVKLRSFTSWALLLVVSGTLLNTFLISVITRFRANEESEEWKTWKGEKENSVSSHFLKCVQTFSKAEVTNRVDARSVLLPTLSTHGHRIGSKGPQSSFSLSPMSHSNVILLYVDQERKCLETLRNVVKESRSLSSFGVCRGGMKLFHNFPCLTLRKVLSYSKT